MSYPSDPFLQVLRCTTQPAVPVATRISSPDEEPTGLITHMHVEVDELLR